MSGVAARDDANASGCRDADRRADDRPGTARTDTPAAPCGPAGRRRTARATTSAAAATSSAVTASGAVRDGPAVVGG